jgi:type II secretion system protein I
LNNRGFTLLEILITLAIFALGAIALANLQIVSIRGSGFNREATIATTLAQKRMEELESSRYGAITSDETGVQEQNGGITYTITWTVKEGGTAPNRYKYVTVTVTWASKSITLNTIISEV